MKSILRSTAILGSASIVTVAIGLVSAKVTALLLGPSGFGLMALLQAVVSFAVLFAGLGSQTGLVRAGARAVADADAAREAALRRAAWAIALCAGIVVIVVMAGFREKLGELALGRPNSGGWILLVAPAVLLSLLAGVQSSVLNAHRRVGDLARINVISAAMSLLPTLIFIWMFGEAGVGLAVVSSFAVAWSVSYFYYRKLRREGGTPSPAVPAGVVRSAAAELLAFGIPYTASMLAGAGVLMVLPILVLHAVGAEGVGLFRAASAIAVNYLGVLLAAMAQDYFPRVASAPADSEAINRIVNDQMRLILLVGGPVILVMLGAVPFLVPLLYSHRFQGAVDLLEWQLIGDLFKFATWTMSFVIMARLSSLTFFLTEFVSGGVLLAASWFGMRLWGLPGLGIAFLASGVFAFLMEWCLLAFRINLRWTRENIVLFVIVATAMAVLRCLPLLGLAPLRTPAAAVLAMAVGAYSAFSILREVGGWKGLRSWRKGG